jgi:hypothetical protein
MTFSVEQAAFELAVTLGLGAVFGFAAGLMSPAPQPGGQPRQYACRRCGAAIARTPGRAYPGLSHG